MVTEMILRYYRLVFMPLNSLGADWRISQHQSKIVCRQLDLNRSCEPLSQK